MTFEASEAWRSAGGLIGIKIWEGNIGSGTLRRFWQSNQTAGISTVPPLLVYVSKTPPPAGTLVFNVSVMATGGSNANVSTAGGNPIFLLGELF